MINGSYAWNVPLLLPSAAEMFLAVQGHSTRNWEVKIMEMLKKLSSDIYTSTLSESYLSDFKEDSFAM